MPTRNISLTVEQDELVDSLVASGEYQNASEAVRDALRALQQRRQQDALKLQLLRAQIDLGLAAIERGEVDEVDEDGIEAYVASLATPRVRRSRRKPRG